MNIKILAICIAFLSLFLTNAYSQKMQYDSFDYISPVKHQLKLSGTFGELRSGHFHAGIDIKSSNGRSGDPIYAVADGWISRIKVEGGGYGQALYIDHPDGMRTVYGHLDNFIPELEKVIRDSQYLYRSFGVDLHFEKDSLPVKQGEKIAEMGNKGYSYGPHLHFEVRNAQNDVPYNPLKFGFPVKDSRSPVIEDVKIAYLNSNLNITDRKTVNLYKSGNKYLRKQEIKIPTDKRFTFSINTTDRQQGTHNHNGIYQIELWYDSTLAQRIKMDSIPYSVNHEMDAYIDYDYYTTTDERYHTTLILPGNTIPIYATACSKYFFQLKANEEKEIRLEVSDFYGNTSTAEFSLRGVKEAKESVSPSYNYILLWNQANLIEEDNFSIYIPKYGLYRDIFASISVVKDESEGYLSPVMQFHDTNVPLRKPMKIGFYYPEVPDTIRYKMFIASCDESDITNQGFRWSSDTLIGNSRRMGNYTVMIDTIAPTIKTLRAAKYPGSSYRYRFEIEDNFNTGGNVGSTKMWAEIDGKWHLGEEVAKYDRFYIPVPETKSEKWHTLKVYAEDVMGNRSVKEVKFYY